MKRASSGWRVGWLAAVIVGGLAAGTAQAVWQVDSLEFLYGQMTVTPAMTFDELDRPHIAYGTAYYAELQHLRALSGGAMPAWDHARYTKVSTAGGTPGQAYIAAGGGQMYLGYRPYAYNFGTIPAGQFNGTSWSAYTDVPQTSKASVNGVVVTDGGKPHWLINTEGLTDAGLGMTSPGLYLTSKDGAISTAVNVTTFAKTKFLSNPFPTPTPDAILRQGGQTVLDKSGNLHTVQYYEIGNAGYLAYAKGPLGGPFTVDLSAAPTWEDKTGRPSLTVDSAGNPHLAWTGLWPKYGVGYAAWTGSGWDSEWIETGGSETAMVGTFPQVLVSPDGTPHVIYTDLVQGLLKHAFKSGAAWQIESIDTIGTQAAKGLTSGSMSAAMDSMGGIGVAYSDGDYLKYAYLVPEPATLVLLAAGIGAFVARRREEQR